MIMMLRQTPNNNEQILTPRTAQDSLPVSKLSFKRKLTDLHSQQLIVALIEGLYMHSNS